MLSKNHGAPHVIFGEISAKIAEISEKKTERHTIPERMKEKRGIYRKFNYKLYHAQTYYTTHRHIIPRTDILYRAQTYYTTHRHIIPRTDSHTIFHTPHTNSHTINYTYFKLYVIIQFHFNYERNLYSRSIINVHLRKKNGDL